jgi:hypothetical protein
LQTYRLYFLDERGSILLRKDFEASEDSQALQIGHLAARIFSVTCCGFALWAGKRQVWEGRSGGATTKAEAARHIKLDTEETLQRSRWRLEASLKLLARLASTRENRPAQSNGRGAT